MKSRNEKTVMFTEVYNLLYCPLCSKQTLLQKRGNKYRCIDCGVTVIFPRISSQPRFSADSTREV